MRAIGSSFRALYRDQPENLYATEYWRQGYPHAQFCRWRMLTEQWMRENNWDIPDAWLVYITEELNEDFVKYFDEYCHEVRFPPKEPLDVTEIAIDAETKAT